MATKIEPSAVGAKAYKKTHAQAVARVQDAKDDLEKLLKVRQFLREQADFHQQQIDELSHFMVRYANVKGEEPPAHVKAEWEESHAIRRAMIDVLRALDQNGPVSHLPFPHGPPENAPGNAVRRTAEIRDALNERLETPEQMRNAAGNQIGDGSDAVRLAKSFGGQMTGQAGFLGWAGEVISRGETTARNALGKMGCYASGNQGSAGDRLEKTIDMVLKYRG